jgi:hypothetical protein
VKLDVERVAPRDILLTTVAAAHLNSVETGARLTADIADGLPD